MTKKTKEPTMDFLFAAGLGGGDYTIPKKAIPFDPDSEVSEHIALMEKNDQPSSQSLENKLKLGQPT